MNKAFGAVLVALAFMTFVLFIGPFFSIWSINCLFGTEIPLNFNTWCAMAWLLLVFGIRIIANKNDN